VVDEPPAGLAEGRVAWTRPRLLGQPAVQQESHRVSDTSRREGLITDLG